MIRNTFCLQIRYIGLSNETPYGLMKFIQVAEKYASHLKIVSLQVLSLITVELLLYFCFIFHHGTLALCAKIPSIKAYF